MESSSIFLTGLGVDIQLTEIPLNILTPHCTSKENVTILLAQIRLSNSSS